MAGEALHFERADSGEVAWAMGAVPLSAIDSVETWLRVVLASGQPESLTIQIPVAARILDTERLALRGEFQVPSGGAVAARVAAENAAVRAAEASSHHRRRLWSAPFLRPVPGRVTSRFGVWRMWEGTLEGRHDGVDLAGGIGTPVRAANRAVVALVGAQYLGGLVVLLDHGGGLLTSYEHLRDVRVTVGDSVSRGQVIGTVGASGRETGPHLHWGASYGAVAVDPLALLSLHLPL